MLHTTEQNSRDTSFTTNRGKRKARLPVKKKGSQFQEHTSLCYQVIKEATPFKLPPSTSALTRTCKAQNNLLQTCNMTSWNVCQYDFNVCQYDFATGEKNCGSCPNRKTPVRTTCLCPIGMHTHTQYTAVQLLCHGSQHMIWQLQLHHLTFGLNNR